MKIKIIGFDLDGVICPDVRWDGDVSEDGIKRLHNLRDNIYPIFVPHCDFVIITGRPEEDKERTMAWLEKNHIYPLDIHFLKIDKTKWDIDTVVKHKSKWINHYIYYDNLYDMNCFIESDVRQTYDIATEINNEIPIYMFSDYIDECFFLNYKNKRFINEN